MVSIWILLSEVHRDSEVCVWGLELVLPGPASLHLSTPKQGLSYLFP